MDNQLTTIQRQQLNEQLLLSRTNKEIQKELAQWARQPVWLVPSIVSAMTLIMFFAIGYLTP